MSSSCPPVSPSLWEPDHDTSPAFTFVGPWRMSSVSQPGGVGQSPHVSGSMLGFRDSSASVHPWASKPTFVQFWTLICAYYSVVVVFCVLLACRNTTTTDYSRALTLSLRTALACTARDHPEPRTATTATSLRVPAETCQLALCSLVFAYSRLNTRCRFPEKYRIGIGIEPLHRSRLAPIRCVLISVESNASCGPDHDPAELCHREEPSGRRRSPHRCTEDRFAPLWAARCDRFQPGTVPSRVSTEKYTESAACPGRASGVQCTEPGTQVQILPG